MQGSGAGVSVAAHRAACNEQTRQTADTHLLRPASTTNCPWGLQKMVLACCLSNISEREGSAVSVSGKVLPPGHSPRELARGLLPLGYHGPSASAALSAH